MATNDEILVEQPFDMTYYDRPYRCLPRAQYDELARKAAAWDSLYGMVDAAVEMGHPLMVTRGLMADLMRQQREEADRA